MITLMLATQLAVVPITGGGQSLGKNLHWKKVTTEESGIDYQQSSDEDPSFGITSSTYRFKTALTNTSDRVENFILDVQYPLLDYVSLQVFDNDQLVAHYLSGDQVPFGERYFFSRTINFPLRMEQNQARTLVFEIKTAGSLIFPLRIYNEKEYGEKVSKEAAGHFLYYGLMTIMIAYNFLIFLSTKSRGYLFYSLSLSVTLMYQMTSNGTLFQYFLPNNPSLANLGFLLFFFSSFCLMALFVGYFLQIESLSKVLNNSIRFVLFSSLILTFLSIFLPYNIAIKIAVTYGILAPFIFLVGGIYSQLNGIKYAKYFNLAWFFYIVGMITFGLKSLAILPNVFITEYAIQIGSGIEVTLLALALGERYEDIRRQAEEKQAQFTKLQSEMKQELLIKIDTVAGLAHRMNNPLQYINMSLPILTKNLSSIQNELTGLASDEESAILLDKLFAPKIESLSQVSQNIDLAVKKSKESVREICSLSGVDGFQIVQITMLDLIIRIESRFEEDIGGQHQCKIDCPDDLKEVRVACNFHAIVVACSKILKLLMDYNSVVINANCSKSEQTVQISFQANLEQFDDVLREKILNIQYFLRSFQNKFEFSIATVGTFSIYLPIDIATYRSSSGEEQNAA